MTNKQQFGETKKEARANAIAGKAAPEQLIPKTNEEPAERQKEG